MTTQPTELWSPKEVAGTSASHAARCGGRWSPATSPGPSASTADAPLGAAGRPPWLLAQQESAPSGRAT